MKVFVIIPVKDEATRLAQILEDCKTAGYPNLIVVDDGSRDNSAEIAQQAGAIVVSHMINRGAGAATQTGLEAARVLGADVAVTLDGDGQHEPQDIEKLLAALAEKKADLVIGSRFLGRNNRIPLLRTIFNRIANGVVFLLSGRYLTDTQSGMKALNERALETINITSDGYEFSSEMIREAVYRKLTICEVPISVRYTAYSLSKGQNFATGLSTIFKLVVRSLMR